MKNEWGRLEAAIKQFLPVSQGQDILEFWFDTSTANGKSPSLYLVFHAFTTFNDFESTIKKVVAQNDFGYLEDDIKSVSEPVWFDLTEVNQDFGAAELFYGSQDEAATLTVISTLVTSNLGEFRHFSKIFLHWADDVNIKWIRR